MGKKSKKVLLTLVLVAIALSLIAASGSSRFNQIKFGETASFSAGRAGVSFTSSQYTGTVKLAKKNQNNAPGEQHPEFTQRLVDIRLYKYDGEQVKHIMGPVYAYFQVRQYEVKKWEQGLLKVYFFDTWKQNWVPCYTMPVYRNGKVSSLSCRMRVFGLYGLGIAKSY